MGIQINGNTNNINAGIGSLSIEDLNELDIVGVATASNFKTGISNLHDVGLTLTGGQIDVGSNIKLGNAGVVTATSFVGSGANLTSLPSQVTIANNADNRVITGGSGVNLNGESTLTYNSGAFLQTKTGSNPTLTLSRNESVGDEAAIGTLNFANNTANTINARVAAYSDGTGNVGGHLYFETRDPSNSTLSERVRIKSNGYVGIGTNNPQRPLAVTSGTSGVTAEFNIPDNSPTGSAGLSLNIVNRSNGGYAPFNANATLYAFGNSGVERVRIDNNGILLVGHTSSPTSDADKLQVISTSSGTGINIFNYSASAYGNQIAFMKSRNNTIGSNTILNNGDRIGELNFYGNDGSGRSLGAQIQVRINGTPSNDNTPTARYFMNGTNQSMSTRLSILPAGTVGISKNGWATSDHSFGLTVHTGSTSETGPVPDGIMIVSQQNNGNQNSTTGKLMFCGHAQTNGPFLYGDNEQAYGKKGLVFHTHSTANSYSTQLEETARFTHSGYFGLGTGTAVDSLMHIQGNSDSGDEHCQLTIEDEDTTSGSVVPQIVFKGNGSQLCKIRATDSNIIRIYDNNDAERCKINEYGETISEESEHGWSTYEYHAKSGGTRFHYRQVGTGASGTTINLIRVRRHYWGSGNYKITMKQTYYNGSYESIFWLNGHAANGNTTSFSLAHSNENSGNSSWIQKTATSHSAPGNNYAGWTDVYANLGAYTYYEITIEASMMSAYSHNINSIGNDGYALHPF